MNINDIMAPFQIVSRNGVVILDANGLPLLITVEQLNSLMVNTSSGAGIIVFAAASGPPSASPTTKGMIAVNETTNEVWFVNSLLAWQQVIVA